MALIAGTNGGLAVTVATLLTTPASRSACVTVWVPVHDKDAPGASVTGCVQTSEPSLGSEIVTLLNVRFPSLVATRE